MAIERRFCMELVREVFRMKWEEKLSNRFIGRSLRISKSTVGTYLIRGKGKYHYIGTNQLID